MHKQLQDKTNEHLDDDHKPRSPLVVLSIYMACSWSRRLALSEMNEHPLHPGIGLFRVRETQGYLSRRDTGEPEPKEEAVA